MSDRLDFFDVFDDAVVYETAEKITVGNVPFSHFGCGAIAHGFKYDKITFEEHSCPGKTSAKDINHIFRVTRSAVKQPVVGSWMSIYIYNGSGYILDSKATINRFLRQNESEPRSVYIPLWYMHLYRLGTY